LAVTYADRSNVKPIRVIALASLAGTVHQAGRSEDALRQFRAAEVLQASHDPESPFLTVFVGFQYCDLLLDRLERNAWRVTLRLSIPSKSYFIADCRAVFDRAAKTLRVAERNEWMANVALDRLTLVRATLYEAILKRSSLNRCHELLRTAMRELNRAGSREFIVRGLITRAWLRSLTSARTDLGSAQEDLDEAWEIAERGPMRLFMADIHLHRARLFLRQKEYPWNKDENGKPRGPKDDLDAAEKLINDCGYHRRDEELADAKAVILSR
jgi:hypothetical protein